MSHIERRLKEKEEVKQRILEAARQIAAKEGWHSLTIRKIADAIDYTPPIVYEYFENKEDLIKELINCGFNKLSDQFAFARKSETDHKKLIIMLSLLHWDFAFENKELYQLMFSLERPVFNDDMKEKVKVVRDSFLKLANGNNDLMLELLFNWMCLIQGAISIFMKNPNLPEHEGKEPRTIFLSMINRFVNNY